MTATLDAPGRSGIVGNAAPAAFVDGAPEGHAAVDTAPRLVTDVPGPRARAHVARDEAVTSPSLPRAYPFVPVRGSGATVTDLDGNTFLDFSAGIAVNATGHGHPRVVSAIREQAGALLHYSASDFYPPVYTETCEALARVAPMSGPVRVYLGNSGAEVVDAALKLSRHATGRTGAVSFLGAFHGRTYGAMSLSGSKARHHARFGPLVPGIVHAPFGRVSDLAWFEDTLFTRLMPPDEVAAVFVEPIQGEGGYIVPEDGFLEGLRRICDEQGILLVADEIQTGMGRTGRMWAVQHWGVEPDIVLTAKGLASGMPLAALVARAPIMERWPAGSHGSTFGGNPVACAAALATLELLDEGLVANAAARGRQAMDGLRAMAAGHPSTVRDVRGRGLMLGIELATADQARALEWACFRRGLLVLGCGRSAVRLSPPLVVSEAEVGTALRLLEEALTSVEAGEPA